MSSSAMICVVNPDNSINYTRVHYDGYGAYAGLILDKFYNTYEKAMMIANSNWMSSLGDHDNNFEPTRIENRKSDSFHEFSLKHVNLIADSIDCGYAYVFDLENNGWIWLKVDDEKDFPEIQSKISAYTNDPSAFKILS
ncbi:hypothetical protein MM5_031 [Morganella phage vB_Mm5]